MWGAMLYDAKAYMTSIPTKALFDAPEMETALTKMWELIYKHKVSSWGDRAFITLKTAASIQHGWTVIGIVPQKSIKFAIAPLPWAKTNSGTLWPDGWRIASNAKNKEESWRFVKWLCSPSTMEFILTWTKSSRRGSAVARKSVFKNLVASSLAARTGMNTDDIYRIHEQADAVGIAKESETICVHTDLAVQHLEPTLADLWRNKLSPTQASKRMQDAANTVIPRLTAKWKKLAK